MPEWLQAPPGTRPWDSWRYITLDLTSHSPSESVLVGRSAHEPAGPGAVAPSARGVRSYPIDA
jgi:hypothetical protein